MSITTVKVSNVSLGASEHDLKEFFSFSGDIEYVEMQSDTERSQIAFVTFKDAQGADTAVLLSDSENKSVEKTEDCKLKLCGCGFLIKDYSEEEDVDADFYEVVVDEYKSHPYDLDKEFAKDYLKAKKEKQAYFQAKKEREANGEAVPELHVPWWYRSNPNW